MRIAIALLALLTGCSTTHECRCGTDEDPLGRSVFQDTNGDGLPDTRIAGFTPVGRSGFHDTTGDGLPDTRLSVGADRTRDQRIERALEQLERAIAEVRSALR